jgi:hypothetical protein
MASFVLILILFAVEESRNCSSILLYLSFEISAHHRRPFLVVHVLALWWNPKLLWPASHHQSGLRLFDLRAFSYAVFDFVLAFTARLLLPSLVYLCRQDYLSEAG